MDRAQLISKIESLGNLIRQIDRRFDIPEGVASSEAVEFLYEVVCYYYLIANLRNHRGIHYRIGAKGHALPGRHGLKSQHSRFVVALPSGGRIDVCMATYIEDRYGKPRAPDISMQRTSSGEDPSYRYVVAIWDAKHRSRSDNDDVTTAEFAKFMLYMEVLNVPGPTDGDALGRICSPEFAVSGLISNGVAPPEDIAHFLDKKFSCVAHFEGTSGPLPRPSRAEHLAHNVTKAAAGDVADGFHQNVSTLVPDGSKERNADERVRVADGDIVGAKTGPAIASAALVQEDAPETNRP